MIKRFRRVIESKGDEELIEMIEIVSLVFSSDRLVRKNAYKKVLEENLTEDVAKTLDASEPTEKFSILDSYSEELESRRTEATTSVKYMAVNITGARPGETIVGVHNISRGAIMRIRSGVVPASKDDLDKIRLFPDLWTVMLQKLRAVEFFSEISDYEITSWLYENQRAGDFDMAEVQNIEVEVADVGKSTFNKISQERLDEILAGNITNLREVREEFPRKPGSKARRHTLIFFLHWWKISQDVIISTNFDGDVFDMRENSLRKAKLGEEIRVFELSESEKSLGVILEETERVDYLKLLRKRFDKDSETIEKVREECKNFTPAGYKSLLQKLIRYAPLKVKIGDDFEDADFVLCCVFTFLLMSPGSFVPDIQRFVSGQESAYKRLMISILEDSYIESPRILLRFAMIAFLSQRLKSWRASDTDYRMALEACVSAISDPRYYRWNISEGNELSPFTFSRKSSDLANLSVILDEIRSFQNDIGMVRSIVHEKGVSEKPKHFDRPKTMGVEHSIDQHWAPEIAFFLPMKIVQQYAVKGSKPFSEIFLRVFRNVTGVNTRKHKEHDIDENFVKAVKRAQKYVLMAKRDETQKPKKLGSETYTVKGVLDISWISGLVGVIDAKGKPPAMVTLRPEDPHQFVALRKPARGMKDGTLSDERSESAIEKAKNILENGVKLKGAAPPIPGIDKLTIRLENDEYVFSHGDSERSWEEISKVKEKISILEDVDVTLNNTLLFRGEGIRKNALDNFREILKRFDINTLRRALSYVSTNRGEIEVARLSKDGGGTLTAVSIDDVGACQILLYVSLLFPSALERVATYSSKFRVKMFPLIWTIRDILREVSVVSEGQKIRWRAFKDTSTRTMKSYQQESLDEMIAKHNSKKRGHFLWLSVGLGKCIDPNTQVLMWNGEIKCAKDIAIGDLLIGDDSAPRKVLSTCRGIGKMYMIKQIHGDNYIVNGPHILSLIFTGHRAIQYCVNRGRNRSTSAYVITYLDRQNKKSCLKEFRITPTSYQTKQLALIAATKFRDSIDPDNRLDISVDDYLKLPKHFRRNLKGYKVGVDFAKQDVPLDPYMLGVWLGDGTSANGHITNIDTEIIDSIYAWGKTLQFNVKPLSSKSITYSVTGGFHTLLKRMNLTKNKHIPRCYLINDREIRLALLAGLIDTDGYYNGQGVYEIIQKNTRLSDEILYLIRSLGFSATQTMVEKTCTNSSRGRVVGWYSKIIFSGEGLEEIPCRVERKKASPRRQKKNALYTGVEVQPLEEGEYCGFEIDGNSRFLLGDFTVTHNSKIALEYLKYLREKSRLPKYVIWALPKSALRSIIKEIEYFEGLDINLVLPIQSWKKHPESSYVKKPTKLVANAINIIEHDHLRKVDEYLIDKAPDCLFIIDEVHKALNDTKRTNIALEISRLSNDFIAMTGTPIVDSNTYKLIWWLEQLVEFEVNERNFWVAANGMIAKRVNTGVAVDKAEVLAVMTENEDDRYRSLVPAGVGGRNVRSSPKEIAQAFEICYDAADRKMISLTIEFLKKGGVMLVARNTKHQERLQDALIKKGLKEKDIFLLTKDQSIFLTDESVESGDTPDYKVVIVPLRKSEGYSITRMRSMITSVYPSNEAVRQQLEGRINRLSQRSKVVHYRTVHVGILTYVLEKHRNAASLSAVLNAIAEEV